MKVHKRLTPGTLLIRNGEPCCVVLIVSVNGDLLSYISVIGGSSYVVTNSVINFWVSMWTVMRAS